MKPIFFASPQEFREWLEQHHDSENVLLVGYYKKETGRPSLTWPESVDEALCFGWIDGVRRSVDAESYCVRFTPRRKGSKWSAVNLRRAEELIAAGRMHPAGLRAFESRGPEKSESVPFDGRPEARLDPEHEAEFQAHPGAWAFFQAQPPGYRRLAALYVLSAKRPETRQRRLERLIADSAAGRRIGILGRPEDG